MYSENMSGRPETTPFNEKQNVDGAAHLVGLCGVYVVAMSRTKAADAHGIRFRLPRGFPLARLKSRLLHCGFQLMLRDRGFSRRNALERSKAVGC